jgi:hydroxyacylglutathione hydrolase
MKHGPLEVEIFVEPTFGENAYVLSTAGADGKPVGWVIDPSFDPQAEQVLEYLAENGIRLERIILTHGHADHIAGLDAVHEAWPAAEVLIGRPDEPMLADANRNLSAPFGIELVMATPATGDLAPGATLHLGDLTWQVVDTAGHSPGGRSIYCPVAGVAFTGDALFTGSIGRTDFPGSNHLALIRNIKQNLLTLPPDTVVYSGHGPATTVGNERKFNPYVSE